MSGTTQHLAVAMPCEPLVAGGAGGVVRVAHAAQVGRVEASVRCVGHGLDVVDIGGRLSTAIDHAHRLPGKMGGAQRQPVGVIPAFGR